MIKKLEMFDGSKTYMYPNGEVATPERVEKDFPAVRLFPHFVETDEAGQVLFAIQNAAAIHSHYELEIPQEVTDLTEALQQKYQAEQDTWNAQVAVNTAHAMMEQAQLQVANTMDIQGISGRIAKDNINLELEKDIEVAEVALAMADEKLADTNAEYALKLDAMQPVVAAIEQVIKAPQEAEPTITAEERIAAALELLCVINMPDA